MKYWHQASTETPTKISKLSRIIMKLQNSSGLQNWKSYIDELVQERRSSIANTLKLRLSCTNPSTVLSLTWKSQYLERRSLYWDGAQRPYQLSVRSSAHTFDTHTYIPTHIHFILLLWCTSFNKINDMNEPAKHWPTFFYDCNEYYYSTCLSIWRGQSQIDGKCWNIVCTDLGVISWFGN